MIFELTADQLPLLEAAEARHGSKRKALIAALEADGEADRLRAAATSAERAAQKEGASERRAAAQRSKAIDKLERDLKDAQAKLAVRERELAKLNEHAGQAGESLAAERLAWDREAEEHEQELAELDRRAVDHLFCGRCGNWAAPAQWAWTKRDDGALYAHHKACGNHGPGIIGASSWLAHRAPE